MKHVLSVVALVLLAARDGHRPAGEVTPDARPPETSRPEEAPPTKAKPTGAEPTIVSLAGTVIRKPWTKTGESWNAGGGEYYVLKVDDWDGRGGKINAPTDVVPFGKRTAREGVILRPSEAMPFSRFPEFVGRTVTCEGEYMESKPWTAPPGSISPHPVGATSRGSGFKVHAVIPVVDRAVQDSHTVVLGRLDEIIASENVSADRFVTECLLSVERYLKGYRDHDHLTVVFETDRPFDRTTHSEDAIYAVSGSLDRGAVIQTWNGRMWREVEEAAFRFDTHSRIPGLSGMATDDADVALAIGLDDGNGRAVTRVQASSIDELEVLVEHRNGTDTAVTVLPQRDGSAPRVRDPHYTFEVVDAAGSLVPLRRNGFGGGTWWSARSFVRLGPGETMRSRAHIRGYRPLAPGHYRVRLRYQAQPSRMRSSSRSADELAPLLPGVWEGELYSNWVHVEVTGN